MLLDFFSLNDFLILVNAWKLPGVDDTPKGLLGGGESRPEFPLPGGDGVRIEELLGIRKLGRFRVKL